MSFTAGFTQRLLAGASQDSAPALPRLHEYRVVQWTVDVTSDGCVQQILPHPKAPKGEQPHLVLAAREAKARTNTSRPLLITDNAQYVLGLAKPGGKTDKATEKRRDYLQLLGRAADLHPDLQAIARAAATLTPTSFPTLFPVDSSQLITFTVEGRNPHLLPESQAFWVTHEAGAATAEALQTQDAVTGQVAALVTNSPLLKGVPGGKAVLTYQSRNADTFIRYGLETLGVGAQTMEAAARQITRLATDIHHAYQPKGCNFILVHWLDGAAPDPWTALMTPTSADAQALLQAEVQEVPGAATAILHLALLKGQGARLMVLEHQTLTLHLAAHHARHYLQRTGGLPLWRAYQALTRADDRPDQRLIQALSLHALSGQVLPPTFLLFLVNTWTRRLAFSRDHLALLTLALPEILVNDSTVPAELRTAYALGRYAATAHFAHQRLNPGVSLTVTDRFLRLLSQRPVQAYPLMHEVLEKLLQGARRRKPGMARMIDMQLSRASQDLSLPLPNLLTPEQRAALILGYEQTKATLYAEAQARRAAASSSTPTQGDPA